MANTNVNIILDFNKLFKQRYRDRKIEDYSAEIELLKARREQQKKWNYKRGAVIRKYNKILKDPNSTEVQKNLARREKKSLPFFDLSQIDNEIKRLKNEDYIVTIKWKNGDYQIMASEFYNMDNQSLFILNKIEDSMLSVNYPPKIKEKLFKRLDYNRNAILTGKYVEIEKKEDLSETFGPIFFEFIGDYVIIDF